LGFDLEAKAVFLNKVDLNLTRDHHSIDYGPDSQGRARLAAYVCNHPGPESDPATDPTGLFQSTPSSAVDAAIDAVLQTDAAHPQGRNLIACVVMDRMPITGVTGQPVTGHLGETFTRFLVFGPNGDLLPSVNLDGSGEKFVPGACVACHGGTNYFALANKSDPAPAPSQPIFGGFPEDGSGGPDLLSYFLPYDVDNFAFHSQHPLTKDDQQGAIFRLNSNAWQVNRAIAFTNQGSNSPQAMAFDNLFHGWYPGTLVFNSTYVPTTTYQDSESQSFYLNVVARSCRTCHIAMDQANFERIDPVFLNIRDLICGQSLFDPPNSNRAYVMPNSRVTFDRFWLSDRANVIGQPPGTVDQPGTLREYYSHRFNIPLPCPEPRAR